MSFHPIDVKIFQSWIDRPASRCFMVQQRGFVFSHPESKFRGFVQVIYCILTMHVCLNVRCVHTYSFQYPIPEYHIFQAFFFIFSDQKSFLIYHQCQFYVARRSFHPFVILSVFRARSSTSATSKAAPLSQSITHVFTTYTVYVVPL